MVHPQAVSWGTLGLNYYFRVAGTRADYQAWQLLQGSHGSGWHRCNHPSFKWQSLSCADCVDDPFMHSCKQLAFGICILLMPLSSTITTLLLP